MRYRITSPEDCIWFHLITDEFKHVIYCLNWDITVVITPLASCTLTFSCHATICSTAKNLSTLDLCTWGISVINVNITDHSDLDRLEFFITEVVPMLLIELIHVVI